MPSPPPDAIDVRLAGPETDEDALLLAMTNAKALVVEKAAEVNTQHGVVVTKHGQVQTQAATVNTQHGQVEGWHGQVQTDAAYVRGVEPQIRDDARVAGAAANQAAESERVAAAAARRATDAEGQVERMRGEVAGLHAEVMEQMAGQIRRAGQVELSFGREGPDLLPYFDAEALGRTVEVVRIDDDDPVSGTSYGEGRATIYLAYHPPVTTLPVPDDERGPGGGPGGGGPYPSPRSPWPAGLRVRLIKSDGGRYGNDDHRIDVDVPPPNPDGSYADDLLPVVLRMRDPATLAQEWATNGATALLDIYMGVPEEPQRFYVTLDQPVAFLRLDVDQTGQRQLTYSWDRHPEHLAIEGARLQIWDEGDPDDPGAGWTLVGTVDDLDADATGHVWDAPVGAPQRHFYTAYLAAKGTGAGNYSVNVEARARLANLIPPNAPPSVQAYADDGRVFGLIEQSPSTSAVAYLVMRRLAGSATPFTFVEEVIDFDPTNTFGVPIPFEDGSVSNNLEYQFGASARDADGNVSAITVAPGTVIPHAPPSVQIVGVRPVGGSFTDPIEVGDAFEAKVRIVDSHGPVDAARIVARLTEPPPDGTGPSGAILYNNSDGTWIIPFAAQAVAHFDLLTVDYTNALGTEAPQQVTTVYIAPNTPDLTAELEALPDAIFEGETTVLRTTMDGGEKPRSAILYRQSAQGGGGPWEPYATWAEGSGPYPSPTLWNVTASGLTRGGWRFKVEVEDHLENVVTTNTVEVVVSAVPIPAHPACIVTKTLAEVTGLTAGAWTEDKALTTLGITAGDEAVCLLVVNTGAVNRNWGVRRPGSTATTLGTLPSLGMTYVMAPLAAVGTADLYAGTDIKFYVRGVSPDGGSGSLDQIAALTLTGASVGSGSWEVVDLTPVLGFGAGKRLVQIHVRGASAVGWYGVRTNGSTATHTQRVVANANTTIWVETDELGKIQVSRELSGILMSAMWWAGGGYVAREPQFIAFANSAGAWSTVDLTTAGAGGTSIIPAGAVECALLNARNTVNGYQNVGVRGNGSLTTSYNRVHESSALMTPLTNAGGIAYRKDDGLQLRLAFFAVPTSTAPAADAPVLARPFADVVQEQGDPEFVIDAREHFTFASGHAGTFDFVGSHPNVTRDPNGYLFRFPSASLTDADGNNVTLEATDSVNGLKASDTLVHLVTDPTAANATFNSMAALEGDTPRAQGYKNDLTGHYQAGERDALLPRRWVVRTHAEDPGLYPNGVTIRTYAADRPVANKKTAVFQVETAPPANGHVLDLHTPTSGDALAAGAVVAFEHLKITIEPWNGGAGNPAAPYVTMTSWDLHGSRWQNQFQVKTTFDHGLGRFRDYAKDLWYRAVAEIEGTTRYVVRIEFVPVTSGRFLVLKPATTGDDADCLFLKDDLGFRSHDEGLSPTGDSDIMPAVNWADRAAAALAKQQHRVFSIITGSGLPATWEVFQWRPTTSDPYRKYVRFAAGQGFHCEGTVQISDGVRWRSRTGCGFVHDPSPDGFGNTRDWDGLDDNTVVMRVRPQTEGLYYRMNHLYKRFRVASFVNAGASAITCDPLPYQLLDGWILNVNGMLVEVAANANPNATSIPVVPATVTGTISANTKFYHPYRLAPDKKAWLGCRETHLEHVNYRGQNGAGVGGAWLHWGFQHQIWDHCWPDNMDPHSPDQGGLGYLQKVAADGGSGTTVYDSHMRNQPRFNGCSMHVQMSKRVPQGYTCHRDGAVIDGCNNSCWLGSPGGYFAGEHWGSGYSLRNHYYAATPRSVLTPGGQPPRGTVFGQSDIQFVLTMGQAALAGRYLTRNPLQGFEGRSLVNLRGPDVPTREWLQAMVTAGLYDEAKNVFGVDTGYLLVEDTGAIDPAILTERTVFRLRSIDLAGEPLHSEHQGPIIGGIGPEVEVGGTQAAAAIEYDANGGLWTPATGGLSSSYIHAPRRGLHVHDRRQYPKARRAAIPTAPHLIDVRWENQTVSERLEVDKTKYAVAPVRPMGVVFSADVDAHPDWDIPQHHVFRELKDDALLQAAVTIEKMHAYAPGCDLYFYDCELEVDAFGKMFRHWGKDSGRLVDVDNAVNPNNPLDLSKLSLRWFNLKYKVPAALHYGDARHLELFYKTGVFDADCEEVNAGLFCHERTDPITRTVTAGTPYILYRSKLPWPPQRLDADNVWVESASPYLDRAAPLRYTDANGNALNPMDPRVHFLRIPLKNVTSTTNVTFTVDHAINRPHADDDGDFPVPRVPRPLFPVRRDVGEEALLDLSGVVRNGLTQALTHALNASSRLLPGDAVDEQKLLIASTEARRGEHVVESRAGTGAPRIYTVPFEIREPFVGEVDEAFPCTGDAQISLGSPTTPNGTAGFLLLKGVEAHYGVGFENLFRYAIPTANVVQRARLEWTVENPFKVWNRLRVYLAQAVWDEATVTWNTAPGAGEWLGWLDVRELGLATLDLDPAIVERERAARGYLAIRVRAEYGGTAQQIRLVARNRTPNVSGSRLVCKTLPVSSGT